MKKYFSSLFYKRVIKKLSVGVLAIGLLFSACQTNSKKAKEDAGDPKKVDSSMDKKPPAMDETLLTIAAINEARDGKNMEMRFYEREAIYTIDKSNKAYSSNISVLTEALSSNIPLKITTDLRSNTIADIRKATDAEVRAYNSGEGINNPALRIKGVAPVSIDLSKIDTAEFNKADYQLRFPVFRLCNNVVPNYATLVAIFNDCASQGCNNPGPYSITNCIPFQYVRDGCYARAHKMRQMISKKYGYCVEKVFSFAEGPPNRLAVKADKWGGCCVEWWYHVVPLLRLNVTRGKIKFQQCYVIDPGMFNTPVTLSTWLQAQKNTGCNPNANVTSYSIQPGSAYWPLGSSSSFGTDPNYVLTEQTLINYKNLVTCY